MARILIADDAAFMRFVIRKMLEEIGHEIVGEAADGRSAVAKYTELKPDLVTLDITMPGMKGNVALKKIRELDPESKVIIVSALGQQNVIAEAIVNGASDFIIKPFDQAKLIETVEKVLRK